MNDNNRRLLVNSITIAILVLFLLATCSKLNAYDENDLLIEPTTTQEVVIDKIQLQHADAKDVLSILTGDSNGIYGNIPSGSYSSAGYSSGNAVTRTWY